MKRLWLRYDSILFESSEARRRYGRGFKSSTPYSSRSHSRGNRNCRRWPRLLIVRLGRPSPLMLLRPPLPSIVMEGLREALGDRGRWSGRSPLHLHILVRVIALHVSLLHACACLDTWYLIGDC